MLSPSMQREVVTIAFTEISYNFAEEKFKDYLFTLFRYGSELWKHNSCARPGRSG